MEASNPLSGGIGPDQVEGLIGMPADRFISCFESLGDNCEFGLVQRACGAEPLGLLRFANIRLDQLVIGLREGFSRLGRLEDMSFTLIPGPLGDYHISDRLYSLGYHTWQGEGEVDETTLLQNNSARLVFLRRKLLEDLTRAEKIFVLKQGVMTDEADVFGVHDAMRTYGPNTLFWVATGDAAYPAGSVRLLRPGLIRASIDRFAPMDNAPGLHLEAWLDLLVKGWSLARADAAFGTNTADEGYNSVPVRITRTLYAPVKAHVANRGDVRSGDDGWAGVSGSGKAIEGFAILPEPEIADIDITYQVIQADGSLSDVARTGQYRGTRGKRQSLLGLRVGLGERTSETVVLTRELRFVDGTKLGPVADDALCRAPTGAGLEAFRVTLSPRSNRVIPPD